MRRRVKIGLVLAGYALALAAALGLTRWHEYANRANPDWNASAGMYGFGSLIYFLFLLTAGSLVPTGLALFFLRRSPRFWGPFAGACLVLAATGLAAVPLLVLTSRAHSGHPQLWAALSVWSVLRMLGQPVTAAGFVMSVVIAPRGRPRGWLLVALVSEVLVGAFGIFWMLARR